MSEVSTEQLRGMAERLVVYDGVQGGWIHEDHGLQANMYHIHNHLSGVEDEKLPGFYCSFRAQTEIAPDLARYAMRLQRYAGAPYNFAAPSQQDVTHIQERVDVTGLPLPYVATIRATGLIGGKNLHDVEHPDLAGLARLDQKRIAQQAGSVLLYGAIDQARAFDFDLETAFNNRLAALRDRFKIGEPPEVSSSEIRHYLATPEEKEKDKEFMRLLDDARLPHEVAEGKAEVIARPGSDHNNGAAFIKFDGNTYLVGSVEQDDDIIPGGINLETGDIEFESRVVIYGDDIVIDMDTGKVTLWSDTFEEGMIWGLAGAVDGFTYGGRVEADDYRQYIEREIVDHRDGLDHFLNLDSDSRRTVLEFLRRLAVLKQRTYDATLVGDATV